MNIANDIQNTPWFNRLKTRRRTVLEIMKYLESLNCPKMYPSYIIETGSVRIKDNWEGDGQSTVIWNWLLDLAPGIFEAISIDIQKENTSLSKELAPLVKSINGNSLEVLPTLNKGIIEQTCLLYLDSFDWSPELNFESAYHHLCELTTVYARLPTGCLIVVDDRHDVQMGKHWMVEGFLKTQGAKELFKGYQIGWTKP